MIEGNDPVVIDTSNEDLRLAYNMAQCLASLRIEFTTGLKHSRGSVLKHVQQTYGIKARTKVAAFRELNDAYEQLTGHRYGN